MGKKILLSLASAFLIWQSYDLLTKIHELEVKSLIVLFFLAWVINMYITGIFAFAGFAYPTQKLLPQSYYKIHHPQKLNHAYKRLKVGWFKKFLLATFWRSTQQRKKYFNGKRTGISTLTEQSMKSEFGHLLPFIILNLVGIYLITLHLLALGMFTIILNIIGNMYPVILQRQHRMRIQRIKDRLPSKPATQAFSDKAS
jgi:hypothetical protein